MTGTRLLGTRPINLPLALNGAPSPPARLTWPVMWNIRALIVTVGPPQMIEVTMPVAPWFMLGNPRNLLTLDGMILLKLDTSTPVTLIKRPDPPPGQDMSWTHLKTILEAEVVTILGAGKLWKRVGATTPICPLAYRVDRTIVTSNRHGPLQRSLALVIGIRLPN